MLILIEHPPVYTLGRRGSRDHLLAAEPALRACGAEVHETDRGGDVTFHGPGQLVGYPILDLRRFGQGPVWYVRTLESILIEAAARFGVEAQRQERRPGIWAGDAKLASIGVRISGGVTTHGFALNVSTDLSWFDHIVPCGLPGVRMTSMRELLGAAPGMRDVEDAVAQAFASRFDFDLVEAPADAIDTEPALAGAAAW